METIIENINTTEARAIIADKGFGPVSLPTVIQWCCKYKLGTKIGGRWFIDRDKLINFLQKATNRWNAAAGLKNQKKRFQNN